MPTPDKHSGGSLTQVLKGNAIPIVLSVLLDGPSHGYAIAGEIARRADGEVRFSQGTLYPLLHTLEEDGFIRGEWVTVAGAKRPRRVYSITEAGRAELERRLETWRTVNTLMKRLTGA